MRVILKNKYFMNRYILRYYYEFMTEFSIETGGKRKKNVPFTDA